MLPYAQQFRLMLTVQDRFREWIARSRLTQQEIAVRLGRHKSFVTRLKTGELRPTLDVAVQLEALTGIPAVAWSDARRVTTGSPRKSGGRNRKVA